MTWLQGLRVTTHYFCVLGNTADAPGAMPTSASRSHPIHALGRVPSKESPGGTRDPEEGKAATASLSSPVVFGGEQRGVAVACSSRFVSFCMKLATETPTFHQQGCVTNDKRGVDSVVSLRPEGTTCSQTGRPHTTPAAFQQDALLRVLVTCTGHPHGRSRQALPHRDVS